MSDHSSVGRAWDCRIGVIPGSPDRSRLIGFFCFYWNCGIGFGILLGGLIGLVWVDYEGDLEELLKGLASFLNSNWNYFWTLRLRLCRTRIFSQELFWICLSFFWIFCLDLWAFHLLCLVYHVGLYFYFFRHYKVLLNSVTGSQYTSIFPNFPLLSNFHSNPH